MMARIYYKLDENINLFSNVDKIPVWMKFKIEKTISKIGEKEIRIKTFNIDQHIFSLVLCIIASGHKLSPMIVFKGKSGLFQKRDNKFVKEKNFKILVYCQEK